MAETEQTAFRIPKRILQKVAELAKAETRSRTNMVVVLLLEALRARGIDAG